MTKDSELIESLDNELSLIDGALLQVRSVLKRLESARDTLKYTRNVLYSRTTEAACRTAVSEFTDRKRGKRNEADDRDTARLDG